MQWEYLTGYLFYNGKVRLDGGDQSEPFTTLRALGLEGWELASAWFDGNQNETRAVFKRQLTD